jgi:hypothetical protein
VERGTAERSSLTRDPVRTVAIALIQGDTNWFPSEIVSEKYVKEGEVSINTRDRGAALRLFGCDNKENSYFDITGRRLNWNSNRKINGIYLLQSEKTGTCKRFVNTDFSK